MKKIILFICCFFLFSLNASAGVSPELLRAIDHVYNAEFQEAKTIITSFISSHPEDPDGYLLRGITREWYQYLTNKEGKFDKEIMEDYQKARRLADQLLEKEQESLEYKMKLANAYVYISKKQLDTGHKMQAGSSLKKAKQLMLEVIEKDPNQPDAYFAVGLFNYFSDNIPKGFKWLATLLGFKGDRHLGKSYIIKATSAGNLTQVDALYMMYYICANKEKNFKEALPYTRQLAERFPQNILFQFFYAEMLYRTKAYAESQAQFDIYFQKCSALGKDCSEYDQFKANYFVTSSYVEEKNYEAAKPYFKKAMDLKKHANEKARQNLDQWQSLILQ